MGASLNTIRMDLTTGECRSTKLEAGLLGWIVWWSGDGRSGRRRFLYRMNADQFIERFLSDGVIR